jgi:hypothetical protein
MKIKEKKERKEFIIGKEGKKDRDKICGRKVRGC